MAENMQVSAARWNYTQKEGYFCTGPYDTDGDFQGYKVGIQTIPKTPLNKCVTGRGDTLAEALDAAIAKEGM